MLRSTLIALVICVCPIMAHGMEIPDSQTSGVLPVTRSSSGVFEALGPLIRARTEFENGDFSESYKDYLTVVLHDPDNIEALFGLAESALATGNGEVAEKAYMRLAKLNLNSEQAIAQFKGLVLAEISEGTSENPEKRLKAALKLAPQSFRLWNALGQEYDAQKRWSESWAAYRKATNFGFSESGYHNNLGMSLIAQKKYSGAISHFKYALAMEPDSSQFHNNYRFALLLAGQYQAALENVSEAQAATLLSDAGYIAMQRREFSLARMLLEKAIEVSPVYNERAAHSLEQLELRQN